MKIIMHTTEKGFMEEDANTLFNQITHAIHKTRGYYTGGVYKPHYKSIHINCEGIYRNHGKNFIKRLVHCITHETIHDCLFNIGNFKPKQQEHIIDKMIKWDTS